MCQLAAQGVEPGARHPSELSFALDAAGRHLAHPVTTGRAIFSTVDAMAEMITPKQVGALKDAVAVAGSLDYVGLLPKQLNEFIYALVWFMGGPLESVDAFVTQVPGTITQMPGGDPNQHRVYWLRGNTIGSLAVGPAESQQAPPRLSGYLRPISDIRRLELRDAEFYWAPEGGNEPEVRPDVRIHFDDLAIGFQVAIRSNQESRDQVAAFVDALRRVMTNRVGVP
jgi:hypothetical protein